ncbi:MAG: peptidylprolyl isomerase [Flavobacteriales bacterium]
MASLEKIRNRSGLLIGFIGLALAAFVLGDLFSSGDRLFGGNKQILGEVDGEVIEQQAFEVELQKVSALRGPASNSSELRAELWNQKINDIILNSEYEKSGISITNDELAKITLGVDNHEIDPFVKQIFGIQPGQQVSSQQLSASLKNIKETDLNRYNYLQSLISKQRLNQKLTTLVGNANIATQAEAEAFYNNSGRLASGNVAFKSYASVPADQKTVTDADMKAYYDAHKNEFKREASRKVEYAIFDITPSASDNAIIKKEITALKETQIEYNNKFKVYDTIPGFSTETNMTGFLRENSDVVYDPSFKAKGQLSATIDELMHTNEVGFVFGPYFEAGAYKMARLMDKRNDSVQVAILAIEVISSDETDVAVYNKASAFAMSIENSSYDEAVKSIDGGIANVKSITQDDRQIDGLGSDKQLMQWAFKTSRNVGDITRFSVNGKYVVARLAAVQPKGIASFDDIKDQLKPAAEREKAKEYLMGQLNGVSSVQDAASKLGVEVKAFSGVSLAGNSIEGVGYEPIVVGAIMGLSANSVSNPIAGASGIAVASVTAVTEPAASNDYTAIKSQIENGFLPSVNYDLISALREKADINDLRADFY